MSSARAAQIEEIQDETFRSRIVEKNDDEDWSDEDDGAALTDDSEEDSDEEVLEKGLIVPQETIWERLSALKDIVPPSTRLALSARLSSFTQYSTLGLLYSGKALWVISTTMLLWGLPYSLAAEDEMRIQQQERDYNSQQQGAQMLGGSASAPGQPQQQQQQQQQGGGGIRPPGF